MAPTCNDAATLRSAAVQDGTAWLPAEEVTPSPPSAVADCRRTARRQFVTGTCRKHFAPRHTMIVPDHRDVRAP